MKFINYLNKNIYFVLFLVLGLIFFAYPMFLSGFDLMMGDKVSTLYNNYVLEHSFLWLSGVFPHESFWSAPFGYGEQSILSKADTLIGLCPIYWLLRVIFKNPFTSFQVLFLVLCVLNYSAFYYFARKSLNFSRLASAFSSFIFAFCVLRYFRSFEIGYFSQFYTILALIFIFKTFNQEDRMKNHICYLLASICLLLQFYSCFTLGFFAMFTGFFCVIFSLVPKNTRVFVLSYLKKFWTFIAFYLFVIFLLLFPMAYHFSIAGEMRTLSYHLNSIYSALIYVKSVSFLDSFFFHKIPFQEFATYTNMNCSFGIFTTILAIFGIWKGSKYRGFLILTLIFIYLSSCNEIARDLWRIFYYAFPATEGIENINRISFCALIIIALGCAYPVRFFEENEIKNKTITKLLLGFLIGIAILEQIPLRNDINSYFRSYVLSKSEFQKEINDISEKIPKSAKIINIDFQAKNKENFGEGDIKSKKLVAQKYVDTLSLYAASRLGKYSANRYFPKQDGKEAKMKDVYNIVQTVDFNKI